MESLLRVPEISVNNIQEVITMNQKQPGLEVEGEHLFSWIDLPKKECKITEIFKKHKSKFSEANKGLFIHPLGHVYEPEDYRIFFENEKKLPLIHKKNITSFMIV